MTSETKNRTRQELETSSTTIREAVVVPTIDASGLFLSIVNLVDSRTKKTLGEYLHEQKVRVIQDGNRLFFVDEKSLIEGEQVYVPLMLKVKQPNLKTGSILNNCIGIEICDNSQTNEPIVDCLSDWCETYSLPIRRPDDERASMAGHLYYISPEVFLTLKKARTPNLQLEKVQLSLEEIQVQRGIPDTWPEVQTAIAVKTILGKWLESGQVPMIYNTAEHLHDYAPQIRVSSPEETYITDSIINPPTFPISELQRLIAELMNGPFKNIEYRINFQKMSYSDFEWLYEMLLAIYSDKLDDFLEDRAKNENISTVATSRGSALHEFSSICNAFGRRYHKGARSFFPTDVESRALFNLLCENYSLPLIPTESQMLRVFMSIANFFIDMANNPEKDPRIGIKKKKEELAESENLWLTQPEMMLKSAKHVAILRASQINAEIENDQVQVPESMHLEIAGTALLSGNPYDGRPLGASVNFRADSLFTYKLTDRSSPFQHRIRMEDLKVSERRRNKPLDPIKVETQMRSKQFLRLLIHLFTTSEHFKDGVLHISKPTSSFVFKDRPPHQNPSKNLGTFLLHLNPGNGENELEDITYTNDQLQEIYIILSELIVPLLFMINAYPDLKNSPFAIDRPLLQRSLSRYYE